MELFAIYDEQGIETGVAPRAQVHRQGLWHKSAQVFLFNSRGDLLLQRRGADKDLYAGLWDYSVGEHLQPGESYIDGAHRGLYEELGVTGVELAGLGAERWVEVVGDGYVDREIQQAYRGNYMGSFKLDPVEVAEVRYISLPDLTPWMTATPSDFTPWFAEDLQVFGLLKRA